MKAVAYPSNINDLIPLSSMRRDISKQIEEAEWMEEDASTLHLELSLIEHNILNGAVYEPLF